MLTAVRQALPAIVAWGVASGLASFCILVSDADTSAFTAATDQRTWTAVLIGSLVATALAPLIRSPRIPWWAWAIIGLPVGIAIMYLYFFFSPHSWQPERTDAWKSTLLFLRVYPWVVIPASVIAGGLGSFLCHRKSVQSG